MRVPCRGLNCSSLGGCGDLRDIHTYAYKVYMLINIHLHMPECAKILFPKLWTKVIERTSKGPCCQKTQISENLQELEESGSPF